MGGVGEVLNMLKSSGYCRTWGTNVPVTTNYVVKTTGMAEVKLRAFLTSTVDEGEWKNVKTVLSDNLIVAHLSGNPKAHCHVYNSTPLHTILSQINPIHTFRNDSCRSILMLSSNLSTGHPSGFSDHTIGCIYDRSSLRSLPSHSDVLGLSSGNIIVNSVPSVKLQGTYTGEVMLGTQLSTMACRRMGKWWHTSTHSYCGTRWKWMIRDKESVYEILEGCSSFRIGRPTLRSYFVLCKRVAQYFDFSGLYYVPCLYSFIR
jgi:hypothetical protein